MPIIEWKLDTCTCTVIVNTDNNYQPLDAYGDRVRSSCDRHSGLSAQEQYDTAKSENNAKNIISARIYQLFPDETNFDYQFTAEGTLVFTLSSTPQANLGQIQTEYPNAVFIGI